MDFKNGLWLICLVNRRMFDLITYAEVYAGPGVVPPTARNRTVPWSFVRSHHFVVANLSDYFNAVPPRIRATARMCCH